MEMEAGSGGVRRDVCMGVENEMGLETVLQVKGRGASGGGDKHIVDNTNREA